MAVRRAAIKQMNLLEARLGPTLFNRTHRGLTLTKAGESLLADARHIISYSHEAVERARKGEGPTIIECLTYRWQGHHVGDPGEYRDPQELADWKAKEPIGVLEKRGLLTDAEIQEIKDAVEAEIQAACKFAEESPYPDASEAYTDLFVD